MQMLDGFFGGNYKPCPSLNSVSSEVKYSHAFFIAYHFSHVTVGRAAEDANVETFTIFTTIVIMYSYTGAVLVCRYEI